MTNTAYDVLGNLRSRWDKRESLSLRESYCYDQLNRLVKVHANTTTGSCGGYHQSNGDFRYDVLGNITYKTGVGHYQYHNVKKHAVRQAGSNHYSYDNNGSMIVGGGKTFTYATFDKPTRISRNSSIYSEFDYDADRERFKRVDRIGSQIRRTWYAGNAERIRLPSGSHQIKRRIAGKVVVTHTLDAQNKVTATNTNYLLKDHLGSVVAVLDGSGNNIQAMSYDAWGRRSNPNQWRQLLPLLQNDWSLTQYVTRGYTGHEPIDSMGLIHMNGRVYDPHLGRFTQADPFIQFPGSSQSYNRYSYVLNNPLTYTDPSGHFLAVIAGAIAWAAGVTSAVEIAVIVGIAAFAEGVYSGAGLGYALIAGVSAAALAYIGGRQFGNGLDIGFNAPTFSAVAKVGTVGGVSSMLQGGEFGRGFISAGLGPVGGRVVGEALGGIIGNQAVRNVTTSAIVGGTLSSMTGGKFANGAGYAVFASIVSAGAQAARKPTPQEVRYAKKYSEVYGLTQADVDAGYQIDDYTLSELTTDEGGLKAALFVKGDSQVVAFAGTSPSSWANWKANFRQAFGLRSAQYEAGKAYAASLDGSMHFTGHSLGGGIASASVIVTGNSATVFSAAGVHSNTLNGISRSNGCVTHFRSSFDVLQPINALTPSSVPGQQISLGAAGLHGMGGVCKAMGCY